MNDALGDAILLQAPATTNQNDVDGTEKSHNISTISSQPVASMQTTFLDAQPGYTTSIPTLLDPTFLSGHTPELGLGDFLGRKVRAQDYTYSTNVLPVTQTFAPWADLFNNPNIKAKLDNYAFLNCGLEVEFRINGSPSFFGKFLVSYEPMTNWRPTLGVPTPNSANIVEYSQRPHLYLSVEQSMGGKLELPFLYHKNWLDIGNLEDFQNMGRISIIPITPLNTTNGEVGTVNISVYIRATNISLSGTTQALTLQSGNVQMKKKGKKGKSGDEFGADGALSGPASAVANVAGKLANAPIIGPYARATEAAFSGVSSLAKLFGFSRTPVLADPVFVRPTPFGQMANTVSSETVDRLVIDPKQGTIIDSRTAGLDGADEMTIKSIATRESYLTSFDWSVNEATGDKLWATNVTPALYRVVADHTHLTPMAFASVPFRFWRGSLKFRFQVVASMYHRGRYQVQWDPRISNLNPTGEIEAVSTTVIDLATDRDVEIVIPFSQAVSYQPIPKSLDTEFHGLTTGVLVNSNGFLTVSVVNELNSFGTTTPVHILVSVSMGDDVEFASPQNLPADYQMIPKHVALDLALQSDDIALADFTAPGDGAPEAAAETVQQVEISEEPDHVPAIYFGERILSFRSLLKRYNNSFYTKFLGTQSENVYAIETTMQLPRYPICKGHDTKGAHFRVGGGRANYVNLTLFNYLVGAYVGMRGGMRWKVNVHSPVFVDHVKLQRNNLARTTTAFTVDNTYLITSNPREFMTLYNGSNESFAGYSLTNARTQSGLEVELPYYSNYRFQSTNQANSFEGYLDDGSEFDSMKYQAFIASGITAPTEVGAEFHCATGEDFNVFFFLNAPPLYKYDNSA